MQKEDEKELAVAFIALAQGGGVVMASSSRRREEVGWYNCTRE